LEEVCENPGHGLVCLDAESSKFDVISINSDGKVKITPLHFKNKKHTRYQVETPMDLEGLVTHEHFETDEMRETALLALRRSFDSLFDPLCEMIRDCRMKLVFRLRACHRHRHQTQTLPVLRYRVVSEFDGSFYIRTVGTDLAVHNAEISAWARWRWENGLPQVPFLQWVGSSFECVSCPHCTMQLEMAASLNPTSDFTLTGTFFQAGVFENVVKYDTEIQHQKEQTAFPEVQFFLERVFPKELQHVIFVYAYGMRIAHFSQRNRKAPGKRGTPCHCWRRKRLQANKRSTSKPKTWFIIVIIFVLCLIAGVFAPSCML
jgi:hypothetical protein